MVFRAVFLFLLAIFYSHAQIFFDAHGPCMIPNNDCEHEKYEFGCPTQPLLKSAMGFHQPTFGYYPNSKTQATPGPQDSLGQPPMTNGNQNKNINFNSNSNTM